MTRALLIALPVSLVIWAAIAWCAAPLIRGAHLDRPLVMPWSTR